MLNPVAIESLKKIYEEKKDMIEYLIKFGNSSEKIKASYIKEVACMSF